MIRQVLAAQLNLRSSPRVLSTNRLGLLHEGQQVEVLEEAAPPWVRVRASLSGHIVEGYCSGAYLGPLETSPATPTLAPAAAGNWVGPHLRTSNTISRQNKNGRAYPLNEAGAPGRSAVPRAADLHAIVRWLDVQQSARYTPTALTTFCNVYAYDYAYLAGVYLPRVWWTSSAWAKVLAGETVPVQYETTVVELNANSLHQWFAEFGGKFGWRRTTSLDELQAAANAGKVAIISAQRKDLGRPGHICAVVPEGTLAAERSGGQVVCPVQSQAGAQNAAYFTKVWWNSSQFRSFSFWLHD